MGLRDLRLKLKGFRLRRLLMANPRKKRRQSAANKTTSSWMAPVTHGYHVAGDEDSVVVQREQMGETELWFFGVFDPQIGDKVTKFMQSALFDNNLTERQIKGKAKETMKKAHMSGREKVEREREVGSATALVIGGEKMVIGEMGDYRAVVCEDGEARQINSHHNPTKLHRFFGMKARRSSEVVVSVETIYSQTEFLILASTGVWEVMKNQEAVNLIRHMENPEEAAECLTKEALTRMSKTSISCLVIRFD